MKYSDMDIFTHKLALTKQLNSMWSEVHNPWKIREIQKKNKILRNISK